MKTIRRTGVTGLLAIAALGLTACGGGADPQSSSTSSSDAAPSMSTSSTSTSSTSTSSTSTSSGEGSETSPDADAPAELTAPGTELAIGKTATIPQGDEGGNVTVTVTKITKGSSADLSKLKDADKYQGFTPVYVQYEMTGTDSSADLGGDVLEDVDPILTDGRKASTLIIIGTSPFAKCDANSIPKEFGPGDAETTCQVAMVTPDQEVAGAQFAPYEGDYADDGAVVWKK